MRQTLAPSIVCAVALLAGCGGTQQQSATDATQQPAQSAGAPSPATEDSKPPAAGTAAARPEAKPEPAKPKPLVLASGARLKVRTTSALSTKSNNAGDPFVATLEEALRDGDRVIAPRGAKVTGRVVDADDGGRVKGRASISIQLTSLSLEDGKEAPIKTSIIERQARATKGKDAAKIGGGAGIGAAIGAIAGGGRGAAIGAAIGGGAGTATVLATKGQPAVIPSESVLTFELRAPAQIR